MSGIRHDVQNELSSNQAFTAVAVTTNSYLKQSAAQDLSIGRKMGVLFCPTVAASCTTVLLELIQATDAALTTSIDVLATRTVTAAQMALGQQQFLAFPPGSMSKSYIGARVTPTGGAATVSLDAYLMPEDEVPSYKSFPKVVNAAV